MRTAGGVDVGYIVDVDVGDGVLVRVALGEGKIVGVAKSCLLDVQAAKNNKLRKIRLLFFFMTILRRGLQYHPQFKLRFIVVDS